MRLIDLIEKYCDSSSFQNLSSNTKRAYLCAMKVFPDGMLVKKIDEVSRSEVMDLREGLASTPAMGNLYMSVCSILFNYANDGGITEHNPASGMKRFAVGKIDPWPEEAIHFVMENFSPVCMLAAVIALYTAQRQVDILNMKWSDFDGKNITVTQQKTNIKLTIPCHKDLIEELEVERKINPDTEYIVVNSKGEKVTPGLFRWYWSRDCKRLDFRHRFHGLRKTAAAKLAEAGCSINQIASITGHSTLSMVQEYTKGAEQKRLAEQAMEKLEASQ